MDNKRNVFPRKAGPLPQARECLPPFVGRRGPFSPGESNPQTLWFIPLGGLWPTRAGPSDTIVWFWMGAHTFKTVSCRRQAGVQAGGPEGPIRDVCHRAGSPDTAPSADRGSPGSRQGLTVIGQLEWPTYSGSFSFQPQPLEF